MNFNFLDQTAAAAGNAQQAGGNNVWQMILTIGIWVVVIVAAYFLFIRPQKKRQKEEEELRNGIEIGDDVTTIGGIVGRVISVRLKRLKRKARNTTTDIYFCGGFTAAAFFYIKHKKMLIKM